MKIGNLEITTPVFLAPMAGVTDTAYCILAQRMGCGLVYSEMVSDQGINFHNERTLEMLKTVPEQRPLAIQLFSGNPERMYKAASFVASLNCCDMIDINMGCPAPKIVRNNEGSALMKDPVLAYEIMCATREAVKDMPVTVKMRLGWSRDTINAVELAMAAESAGATAITVHGRTREDFYMGTADWREIKKVVDAVRIPVIGNGDVGDGPAAKALMEETGCAAVAIGRAAWGNPWVFGAVNTYLETGEILPGPSWEERLAMARKHLHGLCVEKGERIAVREMRAHASRYFHGLPKATVFRREIMKALTEEEFGRILTGYEMELGLEEPEA